ncbi:lipid-A-disaccharide synthase [Desulfobacter postgatei]|uniref:lipid-A-disaccharide synthase n=1 Tax=Desulfobacter postgatei TaxID=2293 RepID=UPI00259B90EF|nr:lipid-A-disaccharide synthase [uncultured Desulfobacter sp.]
MSEGNRHIMILAGEPSGDFHGAALVRALKQFCPGIRITGIGGKAMSEQGTDIFFPIEKLSAMGLVQVIKQIGTIKQAFSLVKRRLKTDPPDAVVLIDYPGFNLKIAGFIKQHYDIPVCYYIAPKIWAWNAGRLDTIAKVTDHVALIFPFEIPIYKAKKISSTYVGNPLVDEYPQSLPGLIQDNKKGLGDDLVIGMLPGSRSAEIDKLLPVMLATAGIVAKKIPNSRFLISSGIQQHEECIKHIVFHHPNGGLCRIVTGRPKQIFDRADILIAASGTVTLEAALNLVPTVIIYKMSGVAYRLAQLLVKAKYIGLANLIVGRQVMPELIQDNANAETISETVFSMIPELEDHKQQLRQVRRRLGFPGAPKRTAAIILNLIHKH